MKAKSILSRNRLLPVRPIYALPLIFLLTVSAFASDRNGNGQAFSPGVIQAEITYLASDTLRGRDSGEPGNEMAARFVAREFARDGLKPLGSDLQRDPQAPLSGSGYFQPFTFIAGRAVGKGNLLQEIAPGPARALRYNQDFGLSGVSGGGKAEGEIAFVGYGIKTPDGKHDDYTGLDVKGKIVLMLEGSPGNDPHSPLADYADVRRKAITARDQGAAAALVIVNSAAEVRAHSRFDFADASDAGLPVLRVDRKVAGRWLGDSDPEGDPVDRLQKRADGGDSVGVVTHQRVRLVADVKKVQKVTANVVGMIEGSDPILKNEYVVIGAHLDHLGMGGPGSLAKSDKPAIHHGADDNASGTAGVMQLARYFGASSSSDSSDQNGVGAAQPSQPSRPKRSLILICFSGEERGLLGSEYYVNHPIEPLDKTVAMINMDMVGRLRDNKLIVIGTGTAREWNSLLLEANRKEGFTLAESESGFDASDQQSFYTKNVPVLFFFTGTHPDYHTPTDTADKINAPGEAKVLKLVAACAEEIADDPARPTFQRLTTPNQNAPSRGFRVYFGSVPDYGANVEGVQLNGVREGSPAEKAGLKAGDIIIKFGDRPIKNIYDYVYALQDHKPGDLVDVVVKRGAQTLTLKALLAAPPQ